MEAKKVIDLLERDSPLRRAVMSALDRLEEDLTRGEKVRKQLWPRYYVRKYGISNLFRYELPSGARLVYTIVGSPGEIDCIILEVFLTHKEYEERFGYG